MAKRLTAREKAAPALRDANTERLRAIQECKERDWEAIEEACIRLAQHLAPDVQPDWDAYPIGTRRYDRLRFSRKAK